MTKETTAAGMNAAETETSRSKTIEITMAALFIALTYVATAFINVRIPFLAANGGLIGFAFAAVAGKKAGKGRLILAVFVAAIIKVVGYYIAEIILYGSFVAPVTSIPGNLVQIFVAGVIAVPIILVLQKVLHN